MRIFVVFSENSKTYDIMNWLTKINHLTIHSHAHFIRHSQSPSQVQSKANLYPTSLPCHHKVSSDIPWVKVEYNHFTNLPLVVVKDM